MPVAYGSYRGTIGLEHMYVVACLRCWLSWSESISEDPVTSHVVGRTAAGRTKRHLESRGHGTMKHANTCRSLVLPHMLRVVLASVFMPPGLSADCGCACSGRWRIIARQSIWPLECSLSNLNIGILGSTLAPLAYLVPGAAGGSYGQPRRCQEL